MVEITHHYTHQKEISYSLLPYTFIIHMTASLSSLQQGRVKTVVTTYDACKCMPDIGYKIWS